MNVISPETYRELIAPEDIETILKRLGVPQRFLDVPSIDERLERLRTGHGLFIYGDLGTGKTYYAAQIFKNWVEQGNSGLWRTSLEILDELRESYSTNQSERMIVKSYGTCRLLVIDDLGKEAPTDWVLMKLHAIADLRYSNQLPTIVTTQFSPADLAAMLGRHSEGVDPMANPAAIVSRFIADADHVPFTGKDRRL